MEGLIPIINELQTVFKRTGTEDIKLPQIVVVGTQSCGKSSVLESLVGRSFLPRGIGIVTRCPTILQLKHIDNNVSGYDEDGIKEWCSFTDEPLRKYANFDEVREQIEKRTNTMAGENKGICMDPIIIRVCSPNVIDLTVVDLPGVVKVPVGDQPHNIEEQVRNLIMTYITNDNAIILAVSPANADIATSESIKFAKEVDPYGRRTIAVITKLDLMDKGTDASNVLSGDVIQVKHGIIGVVNRSQFDINNDKSIEASLEDEESFFRKHYPQCVGFIGTPYLKKRLQQLLQKHIQDCLPDLIKRIGDLTDAYELRKHELGPEIAGGSKEKFWVMLQMINDFLDSYKASIKERSVGLSEEEELFAAQIANTYDKYSEDLMNQDTFLEDLEDKISTAIRKSVNIERFTSIEDVFKSLVKKQIMLMEKPSMECADAVHGILFKAVEWSLKDKRLDSMNSAICRITRKVLKSQLKDAKRAIQEYMKIQTGMIFSSDNEFLSLLKVSKEDESFRMDLLNESAVEDALEAFSRQGKAKGRVAASFPLATTVHGQERGQTDYVKQLITSYFNVIRRQIADYMPKHLMYHLYECTMDKLRDEIKQGTAGRENELISEPENIVRKRKETEEMLENLYQATEIIGGIQSKY